MFPTVAAIVRYTGEGSLHRVTADFARHVIAFAICGRCSRDGGDVIPRAATGDSPQSATSVPPTTWNRFTSLHLSTCGELNDERLRPPTISLGRDLFGAARLSE